MSTANQLYNRTVAKNTTLAKRHSHQKGYNHERLAIQAQEYGYDVNENGQLKYYVVGTVLNSSAEKEGQLTKDTAKVYLRNVDEEVEFRQKTNKRDPNQLRDTTARFFRNRDINGSLQRLAEQNAEILVFDYPRVEQEQLFVDADGNNNKLLTVSAKTVKSRLYQPTQEKRQQQQLDRIQIAVEGMANIALSMNANNVPRARVELIEGVDSIDIQPKQYDERGKVDTNFAVTREKVVGLFRHALSDKETQNYLIPNQFTPVDKNGVQSVHNDAERTGMMVMVLKENNIQADGTVTRDPLDFTVKIFPERKPKFKGRDKTGQSAFVSTPDDPLETLTKIMSCQDKPTLDYVAYPTDSNFERAFAQDVARVVLGHVAGYATDEIYNSKGPNVDYVTSRNPAAKATLSDLAKKLQEGNVSVDLISGRKFDLYLHAQDYLTDHLKPAYFEAYPDLKTNHDLSTKKPDTSLAGYTVFSKNQSGEYEYTEARHKFAPTLLLLSPITQERDANNEKLTASPGTLLVQDAFSINLRGPRPDESCYYEEIAEFIQQNPHNLATRGRVSYMDPSHPGPNPMLVNKAIMQYLNENPLHKSADAAEQAFEQRKQQEQVHEVAPVSPTTNAPMTTAPITPAPDRETTFNHLNNLFEQIDKKQTTANDVAQEATSTSTAVGEAVVSHPKPKPDIKTSLQGLLKDIKAQKDRATVLSENVGELIQKEQQHSEHYNTNSIRDVAATKPNTPAVTHEQNVDVPYTMPTSDLEP